MKRIRTLIADDEKPARDRLKLALVAMKDIQIVGEAVNGSHAVELIRELKPELVFMDVQMPVMDGFEALQLCKERPFVIFTTAYDEYALRAFEVHAVDYLLKPYSKERLRAAIEHTLERFGNTAGTERLISEYRNSHPYWTRMSIRDGRTFKIIPVELVDFFKAEDGLVFWVENAQRKVVDETLNELEANLDPSQFLRIHRNAIANIAKIVRVLPLGRGRFAAGFSGGEQLEVGRSRMEAFRRSMRLS